MLLGLMKGTATRCETWPAFTEQYFFCIFGLEAAQYSLLMLMQSFAGAARDRK
jgi:hypothetical protein